MIRVYRQFIAWAVCVQACLIPASATVLLPADLAELAHQADVIVRGRVTDVQARRISGGRIDSLVTFEPAGYLKGNFGESVMFQVPGGLVGRYRSVVIGAPVLTPGDELVVFLGGQPPALPHLLGMSQGVFRVVRDRGSGRDMVSPPALVNQGPGRLRIVRGDPSRRPVSIGEFSEQVAKALAAPRPATLGGVR